MEKHFLRRSYGRDQGDINHGPIDEKFVLTYHVPQVKQIFANQRRFRAADNFDTVLSRLADEAIAAHDYPIAIRKRPLYKPIRICIELFQAIGITSIFSARVIKQSVLEKALDKWKPSLDIEYVHQEFEIRKSRLEDIASWTFKKSKSVADAILKQVLGISIKAIDRKCTKFKLRQEYDFSVFENEYPDLWVDE
jgi:hypothetical protein